MQKQKPAGTINEAARLVQFQIITWLVSYVIHEIVNQFSCRQIALADLILVNKVDLVGQIEINALRDKIR